MLSATSRSLGRLVRSGAGLVLILALLVGCISPAAPLDRSAGLGPLASPQPADPSARVRQQLASAPLLFEENRGQTDASVGFLARGPAMTAFFTPGGVTYRLLGWGRGTAAELKTASTEPETEPETLRALQAATPPAAWLLQHELIGGRAAQPAARGQAETVVSYFKGQPEAWITGVPTYGELTYGQVWPGIDVVYRADGPQLKSGYVVDAGADPGLIQLRYRGGAATITERGELEIATGIGALRESAPVAWQETAEGREPVAVRF